MSNFVNNTVQWMKDHPTETCMIAAVVVVFIIGVMAGRAF